MSLYCAECNVCHEEPQFHDTVPDVDASRCQEYFDLTVAYAKQVGLWEGRQGLRAMLTRLCNIASNSKGPKPVLYKDFARLSFTFDAGGLYGGLIFHGPGAGETFTVRQSPCDGWSIHT